MKKIFIILLIILLAATIYVMAFNGIGIANFTVFSYSDIQGKNQDLDAKLSQASMLTSISYPEKLSALNSAADALSTTKQKYEDKIAYSSEDDIKLATQVKEYRIEFLHVQLGQYALKAGISIDLEFEQQSSGQNIWDIHFVAEGRYLPITEFIRYIEDDDELNFRIEGFKLTPGESTDRLKADFYVRNIGLTDVDTSIVNSAVTIPSGSNNTNSTNNTTNTAGNSTDNTNSGNAAS